MIYKKKEQPANSNKEKTVHFLDNRDSFVGQAKLIRNVTSNMPIQRMKTTIGAVFSVNPPFFDEHYRLFKFLFYIYQHDSSDQLGDNAKKIANVIQKNLYKTIQEGSLPKLITGCVPKFRPPADKHKHGSFYMSDNFREPTPDLEDDLSDYPETGATPCFPDEIEIPDLDKIRRPITMPSRKPFWGNEVDFPSMEMFDFDSSKKSKADKSELLWETVINYVPTFARYGEQVRNGLTKFEPKPVKRKKIKRTPNLSRLSGTSASGMLPVSQPGSPVVAAQSQSTAVPSDDPQLLKQRAEFLSGITSQAPFNLWAYVGAGSNRVAFLMKDGIIISTHAGEDQFYVIDTTPYIE